MQKDFLVHENYNTSECTLELLNVQYEDGGNYTQKTKTFEFTLNLEVTANRDWVNAVKYLVSTLAAVLVVGLFSWSWFEVHMKQLKKLTKDERSWMKKLKRTEGEEEIEEAEKTDEMKSRNPTMETIQKRVNDMIQAEKLLTTGQICQVLNILNDEVTLQASSSK